MFLNFEDTLVSKMNEAGEFDQILGTVMAQEYILKVSFKFFFK